MARYIHSISLNDEQNSEMETVKTDKISHVDIYMLGVQYLRDGGAVPYVKLNA